MDEQLPGSMIQMLQTCSIAMGVVATIGLVDHLMITASVVMFIIIYVVQIYYVKITQNIKRLEGIGNGFNRTSKIKGVFIRLTFFGLLVTSL